MEKPLIGSSGFSLFTRNKEEVIKIEQWLNIIRNFGFPIVVTFYLLLRFEKKIDHLTEAINKIATSIEKEQDKQ
ncbi:YvrJ family protein [Priestia aryabhattai]|uniref:YvrJ family protein n=1 Tax=Priestia aryabhattai TaxID=412384 RepID=UPI0030EBEDAE